MKKAFLLLLCGTFAFCACQKDPVPSKDATLDGQAVDVSAISTSAQKLFVLNEGGMGSNNSTLDFLRFKDGQYITGAFKKMNPSVGAGLGDVGNDIAIHGNEAWIVVNNSGIVEVISAQDETEIAAIQVPTPRNIAFDDNYAYVTSWAGAFVNYGADYSVTDSSNPKGQVYRIGLTSKKVEGTVEVGYQPEGIAYYNGKLYVANSGGISSQLPPNYSYDNTVSIIDAASFKVEKTVEVQVNLKNVYSDGKGAIYITSLGNYYDIHSGLYAFLAATPERTTPVGSDIPYVTCAACVDGTMYCLGTLDEYDWSSQHTYTLWSCTVQDHSTGKAIVKNYSPAVTGTPMGIGVIDGWLFVGDAGDYFNTGAVSCYNLKSGAQAWSVTAGVCPAHFALY